tara:strand:- start:1124 stop:1408 length:285 start_codon:yes stop_codon:yes gene_type:complete
MISLTRYEAQQDEAGAFDDALVSYLEDNYTELSCKRWLDVDDNQVFAISDSVRFEGGEMGDGFKDYKSVIDDPEELSEIIAELTWQITKLMRDR